MINEAIAALGQAAQAQLMYAFNEGIAQYIIIDNGARTTLKLPDTEVYYVGCNLINNPECFKMIQESGVWSFGIYKGCLCS